MFPLDDNFREQNYYSSRITIKNNISFLGINQNLKECLYSKIVLNISDIASSKKKERAYSVRNLKKSCKFNKNDYNYNKTFLNLKKDTSIWNVEINNKRFLTDIKRFNHCNVNEESYLSIDESQVNDGNFMNIESNRPIGRDNVT
jgi:hypothetical protein